MGGDLQRGNMGVGRFLQRQFRMTRWHWGMTGEEGLSQTCRVEVFTKMTAVLAQTGSYEEGHRQA